MDVDKLVGELLADLKANRITLPTLPQVALKINDAIDSPEATAKSVAKVVGTDVALSARLIQVANSPLVRGNAPAENIQAAVTRMGMRMVRDLVTAFLVRQLFHTKYQELRQRMSVLWNHSAHVAAISHVLASHFTNLRPEEAMLAGLVHDIGKLPIIAKAESMPGLIDKPEILDKLIDRLHTTIGKVITQSWRFSPELVEAVAEHENLERNSEKLDYADIVTVANLHSYAGKSHRLNQVRWSTVPAFKKLKLDPDTSVNVLEEAHDEIGEIQKLLSGD
jgi:putative nucleotidyltransferase with HDIG domain